MNKPILVHMDLIGVGEYFASDKDAEIVLSALKSYGFLLKVPPKGVLRCWSFGKPVCCPYCGGFDILSEGRRFQHCYLEAAACRFALRRDVRSLAVARDRLTVPPCAETVCPTAMILTAAFTSRSWRVPQLGHAHSRTDSGIFVSIWPHAEHVLLDGYQRSMRWTRLP